MDATGWNTWDVDHVNAFVYRPGGLEVRFSLVDERTGEVKERFFWKDVRQLGPHAAAISDSQSDRPWGPHAAGGSYNQLTLQWGGGEVELEMAGKGAQAVCRVTPGKDCRLGLLLELHSAWGEALEQQALADGWSAQLGGARWRIRLTPARPILAASLDRPLARWMAPEAPLWVWIEPEAGEMDVSAAERFLDSARQAYASTALRSQGWLRRSAEGLVRSIHWNTIWEPLKGRVCTPVSREWCWNEFFGKYVLFDWDTFFCALMAALEAPDLAVANLQAILQEVTPRGFVPNFGSALSRSDDRSQPPVGAYCALKLSGWLEAGGEPPAWLEAAYPLLLRWHQWWMGARDGNRDGLLEWGSDPVPPETQPFESGTLRAAMYESGLDNSPMYDDAAFNQQVHTMELADVGLNALYALDAWALGQIAERLSQPEAAGLMAEYAALGERINRQLWNEAAGIYQNRHWDGRFSEHLSPTNFYPLLAGIVPPERAGRMLREHLMNPEEFWGTFVLPSIARSDAGYRSGEMLREGISASQGDYWRGRIWGPMNYLVCEGLRRAGFDEATHALAEKSLALFNLEWESEGHVHENYNDLNGDGDDVSSSNPMYHWGALLAYLAMQELVDYEPWAGWRFGNACGEAAALRNLRWQGRRMDVFTGEDGLRVEVDGQRMLSLERKAWLRAYRQAGSELGFQLVCDQPVKLVLGLLPAGSQVELISAEGRAMRQVDARGELALEGLGAGAWSLRLV